MVFSKRPTSLVLVWFSDMISLIRSDLMLVKLIFLFLFFSLMPAKATYNLYSPEIELPPIGGGETMHFGFWLHIDTPDSDWIFVIDNRKQQAKIVLIEDLVNYMGSNTINK